MSLTLSLCDAGELEELGERQPLDCPRFIIEPKYDGERGLVIVEVVAGVKVVKILNRRGRDITGQFPEVALAAQRLPAGTVLDGELTVPRLDGGEGNCPSTAWRATVRADKVEALAKADPALFAAFDVLFNAGEDLRALPLRVRREKLEELWLCCPSAFFLVPSMLDGVEAWKVWVLHEGSEGVIKKELGAPYAGARSPAWLKIKAWEEADFEVVGYTSQKRAVSTLKLANGFEVNCPRAGEGQLVVEALARGERVWATVKYLKPYRFPRLFKVWSEVRK